MSDDMNVTDEMNLKFQIMERAITDYFAQVWEDNDENKPGDFIPDWAVVIYYQNLDDASQQGYVVETRENMPAHIIKGLLTEGIDWIDERQHSDE